MRKRGTITFGAHGQSHETLAGMADPSPDIAGSMKDLKDKGGIEPDSFCYPYGNYRPNTPAEVRRAGFTSAVICNDQVAKTGPELLIFEVPRVSAMGGRRKFAVTREPSGEGSDTVVFDTRDEGMPITVSPHLTGIGLAPDDGWLAPAPMAATNRTWRWTLHDKARHEPLQVEIWDVNRILRLWPSPP